MPAATPAGRQGQPQDHKVGGCCLARPCMPQHPVNPISPYYPQRVPCAAYRRIAYEDNARWRAKAPGVSSSYILREGAVAAVDKPVWVEEGFDGTAQLGPSNSNSVTGICCRYTHLMSILVLLMTGTCWRCTHIVSVLATTPPQNPTHRIQQAQPRRNDTLDHGPGCAALPKQHPSRGRRGLRSPGPRGWHGVNSSRCRCRCRATLPVCEPAADTTPCTAALSA